MSAPEESQASPVRVFISYSHDSREHCDRVLDLARQLRSDGIDAEVDQFHQNELVHWPSWCEEQLRPENSKYVLCVCTAKYLGRVENRFGADVGKGVFWEGRLIYDYIYDAKGNDRFVPIFLGTEGDDWVPGPLRGYTRFRLKTFQLNAGDPDYEDLYWLLTERPKVKLEPVGKTISVDVLGAPEQVSPRFEVPGRKTDFMGRLTGPFLQTTII
jgi:TIR domain